ncbi:alpha/beta fold hydrolase [Spirochaeta africana]|uniref:Putative hydrolase or acyltransferase of alpha/beta superfamily n=1 Tax=Spirochaeta africana (strain ATCC 700263 / DSM 8902 / Z-7692) TaxID=889378 RepID=H9ULZ9_SPIAZ|nr:alpha/beta fold hydrolase [Spirochaeta africana]AFG38542.1 putative hydrolase or acyltransferase of alpha/beta superfamily [Spirochaeta africana DSM 8902]
MKSCSSDQLSPAEIADLTRKIAGGEHELDELIAVLLPMISGARSLQHDLALELAVALADIERISARQDELYALVYEQGAPAIALTETGQILALNSAAAGLWQITAGDGLAALRVPRSDYSRFIQRVRQQGGTSLLLTRGGADHGTRPPVLVSGSYHPGFHAFILSAVQHSWPTAAARSLQEIYALTDSETEILGQLSRGNTLKAIAEQRTRALGTVRQQVKSILFKLGVSSQTEAAALAAAAAATIGTRVASTGSAGDSGSIPLAGSEEPLRLAIITRSRRRIGWRHYGSPTGRPVLMLHGPSFGAGEYAADRRLARRYGLSIYALERPGYGRTDLPDPEEAVLDCICSDATVLLDRIGLSRVTLLAHEAGLIPALELAHRVPERIAGVLAVSAAPPFLALEQIQAIPAHQGVFIQAARHAPWLAHLLIRLLMVHTRRLGPIDWTQIIFRNLSPDTEVMQRPDLAPGKVGTYSFYINQMGAGFEQDLHMMLSDWRERLTSLQTPLHLLHGSRNPTTPVPYLDVFTQLQPRAVLELVPQAGLTLAVSHPQLIYARLAEISRTELS